MVFRQLNLNKPLKEDIENSENSYVSENQWQVLKSEINSENNENLSHSSPNDYIEKDVKEEAYLRHYRLTTADVFQ